MAAGEADIVSAIINRSDWRAELVAQEAETAARLQGAYGRILPRVRQSQNDLLDAMEATRKKGETVDPRTVRDMQEFSRLLVQVETEMDHFSIILSNEMSGAAESAITAGMNGALEMANGLGGTLSPAITAAWVQPNPAALRNIVNYMDSAGMQSALSGFGDNAARDVSDLILGLAAQGKNPRFIARVMEEWNSVPYAWADNMARTVTIYSARTASHASYVANADILDGWMWVSATDVQTCISCWSKHGRIFDLKQILNDHHRGRCTAVPVVKGTTWRETFKTGPDVFAGLDEKQQREIMGKSMHEAWKRNEVSFEDFSVPYENDIYGEMTRAASLKELQRNKLLAVGS